MPFNFSGQSHQTVAKQGVVSDGDTFTVGSDGYTITSTMNPFSAFVGLPARASAGAWSIQLKDRAVQILAVHISSEQAAVLLTQLNLTTIVNGKTQINWTFVNTSGAATDLAANAKFKVWVEYTDAKV